MISLDIWREDFLTSQVQTLRCSEGSEGHRGGRDPVALVVGNHLSGTIPEDSYTAVGGPEVDTNGEILARVLHASSL